MAAPSPAGRVHHSDLGDGLGLIKRDVLLSSIIAESVEYLREWRDDHLVLVPGLTRAKLIYRRLEIGVAKRLASDIKLTGDHVLRDSMAAGVRERDPEPILKLLDRAGGCWHGTQYSEPSIVFYIPQADCILRSQFIA